MGVHTDSEMAVSHCFLGNLRIQKTTHTLWICVGVRLHPRLLRGIIVIDSKEAGFEGNLMKCN